MNDTPSFPLPAPTFAARSRQVEAGACFDWLAQGWVLFLAHRGVWIGSTLLLLLLLIVLSVIPVLGQFAMHVLAPLFSVGMLKICRRAAEGEEPQLIDFFAGFHHHGGGLIMVGILFAAGIFGSALLVSLLFTQSILGSVSGQVAGYGIIFGRVMLAGLLVTVLSIPVIMATWFAPALVFFHGMPPVEAMKASFIAGARNWLAMLVFTPFLLLAMFFAMLPLGLGLLVFLPIFSGAVYASYRDIFTGV